MCTCVCVSVFMCESVCMLCCITKLNSRSLCACVCRCVCVGGGGGGGGEAPVCMCCIRGEIQACFSDI